MNPTHQLRDADKRAALHQVLSSATFVRASQVRNFLRYICEMELAGRGATLHEYLIGVEALGRPTAYSTEDDSSVRRRAYALRQKLDEVYAKELTDAPIGPMNAFVRDLVHILDGMAYVGYLWPLWDDRRQTFADKIVRTVVINAS